MKQERVFPKFLNLAILLISIATILCFAIFHFGAENTTAWDFLLGSNYESLQAGFISGICANFKFFGYCFIYILYASLFLAFIDIFLCIIMFIPSIRKNSFMALLYKTFLIVFGFFGLLCYLLTLVFMILYFVAVGKAGISFRDFFTTAQQSQPIFWITIIMFVITASIAMIKLMAYKNYSRPV